ncbi:AbgT family transporter, partial [Vibrio lentus]
MIILSRTLRWQFEHFCHNCTGITTRRELMSSSASIKNNSPKKPIFTRFLDGVEYLG